MPGQVVSKLKSASTLHFKKRLCNRNVQQRPRAERFKSVEGNKETFDDVLQGNYL